MQIVETKNNLAKIVYNPEQNSLVLSCFLVVKDNSQMFLAQVINLEAKSDKNYAIIKMLFNFDEQGNLTSYNGGMPAINAEIECVRFQDVLGIFNVTNPLLLGNIEQENISFVQDMSLLNDKALVCVDNEDEKRAFVLNILSQLANTSCKIVVFDTLGTYSVQNKIVAGENFKLPLNYDTINFIYEKGLPDASGETKALIQEIFLEVQNYVRQLPEKFIPFENFKIVVDAQYEETQINELVLLKNRLLKYYDEGVFAQDKNEFDILVHFLMNSPVTVIDISKFNGELQREVISYVYKVMKGINSEFYSFVEVEDENTDKKLLKQIFVTTNVNSTIISSYKYKYIREIKQLSRNLILFAPIQQQDDFAGYNVFLGKLNHNEFVIYGDKTKYVPFIVTALPEQSYVQEHNEEVPQEFQEEPVQQYSEEVPQEFQEEPVQQYSEEVPQEFQEEPVQQYSEEVPQEFQEEPVQQYSEEVPQEFQEEPVQQYSKEVPQEFQEEPVQQYSEEVPQEFQEEPIQNELTDDDLDFIEQNISETEEPVQMPQEETDGDGMLQNDSETEEPAQIPQEEIDGDAMFQNIPDDDEDDQIPQYQEEQEFKETPIVPVYPAEQPENSASDGEFAQGDEVLHDAYGHGVVEKIISYGNKKLCSIVFDNNGKKLLDPAITQLKKM